MNDYKNYMDCIKCGRNYGFDSDTDNGICPECERILKISIVTKRRGCAND
jgi:DNA-directed RNA polymerase subunit RPC12/RpoP